MTRNTRSRRRDALKAPKAGGAEVLRSLINTAGYARCTDCGGYFDADQIDVDHIRPLAHGGEDTHSNVQALCRQMCHAIKTRTEFIKAPAPL